LGGYKQGYKNKISKDLGWLWPPLASPTKHFLEKIIVFDRCHFFCYWKINKYKYKIGYGILYFFKIIERLIKKIRWFYVIVIERLINIRLHSRHTCSYIRLINIYFLEKVQFSPCDFPIIYSSPYLLLQSFCPWYYVSLFHPRWSKAL
jgi:hypothetical protein